MTRVCVLGLALVLLGAASAEEQAKEPPIPVEDLFETFRSNEARAEKLYVGKEIDIVGRILRVMKNRRVQEGKEEDYYIGYVTAPSGLIQARAPFNPAGRGRVVRVRCYFPRTEMDNLAGLTEAQEVVIRGVCQAVPPVPLEPDDRTEATYSPSEVVLRNCKIVRVKEVPDGP